MTARHLASAAGFAAALAAQPACAKGPVTAITGVTVVDVSAGGESAQDVPDAVVVIQDGKILAAGPAGSVAVPKDAQIIARPGKFVIPGLVDGFTGLRNQAEANADLYEGVTTIVGSGDDRRGRLFESASPGPHLYPIDSAGSTDDWSLLRESAEWRDRLADNDHPHELSAADTFTQLHATAKRGTRAIWIGWNITAANTRTIVAESHRLGMVTYGEFIATPYRMGIEAGVDALLHMSRYELGLADAATVAPLAAAPYGTEARAAYRAIDAFDPVAPQVADYGRFVAAHHVSLIPTFSLFYLDLPNHRNLWATKAAGLLDPHETTFGSDPKTGEDSAPPELKQKLVQKAEHLWRLNGILMDQHPPYLAASGAMTLGALAGISLHVEMEMLVRRGLTPREALAAATSNYADRFGWRELGEISPGRRADLVILNADPTQDIRNADDIHDVMLSGVFIDRDHLRRISDDSPVSGN